MYCCYARSGRAMWPGTQPGRRSTARRPYSGLRTRAVHPPRSPPLPRTTPSIRHALEAELVRHPLLLDGALGTELSRRGVETPLPLWSTHALLSAPEVVAEVHADYVRAGARLITANTFRTDRFSLAKADLAHRARELNELALSLARRAVAAVKPARPLFIAASVAPLADCYEPEAAPDDETLQAEHGLRVGDLVAAGFSLALVETMNSIREARAALGACKAHKLPALVSFVCGSGGRLLSGESIHDAAEAVEDLDPLALLINCCAPKHATAALRALLTSTTRPTGVYANGYGKPHPDQGWIFQGLTRRRSYIKEARRWLDLGARLIGGCCGTDPQTIRSLATSSRLTTSCVWRSMTSISETESSTRSSMLYSSSCGTSVSIIDCTSSAEAATTCTVPSASWLISSMRYRLVGSLTATVNTRST